MIYTVTLNPAIDKEYTVPQLVMNEVLRASSVRADYGGKGFNVSRMLAVLGGESRAVGFVGGHTGQLLQDGLISMGIATDFVWIEQESRTNISIFDDQHKQHIKLNEPGPLVAAEETRALMEKIRGLVQSGDWWVLAGSLTPGVPEDIFAQIITLVQAGGARAILDTSGQPLFLGCQAKPYLVKPNASEAEQLAGLPADTIEELTTLLPSIHKLGAQNIVVSAGKKGALLSDGKKHWLGSSPPIKEQNPTGAGDAMVGGLVFLLASGESLATALSWGIACGAAAASQPGTRMPARDVVEELLKKIKITEV
ncbi:MAG: 1-phosphofructokinase [Pelolinea sp.]|nr:1-phosphofructokinase [Pelolinea sp.]